MAIGALNISSSLVGQLPIQTINSPPRKIAGGGGASVNDIGKDNGQYSEPPPGMNRHNQKLSDLRGITVDGFYLGIPRTGPGANETRVYDPDITSYRDVPAYRPKGVSIRGSRQIFINGQNVQHGGVAVRAGKVAQSLGRETVALMNETTGVRANDFLNSFDMQEGNVVDRKAIAVATRAIYYSAKKGEPIHFVAHSQGALVLQIALADARAKLVAEYGAANAEQMLGKVSVETYGAPVTNVRPFASGPRYIHFVNTDDPVPTILRRSGNPFDTTWAGKNAVIFQFSSGDKDAVKAHSLDLYLKMRGSLSFDQIYSRYAWTDGNTAVIKNGDWPR
jgi:hypothetical protein